MYALPLQSSQDISINIADRNKSSISAIQSEKNELVIWVESVFKSFSLWVSVPDFHRTQTNKRGNLVSNSKTIPQEMYFFRLWHYPTHESELSKKYWSHYLIISSLFRLWPSPHNWRRRRWGCLCARPRPTGLSSSSKITTGLSSFLHQ